MKSTTELIAEAKTAASAEELLAMAKANGLEITEAEAAQYYNFLNATVAELPDEALDAVAGGKGGKSSDKPPKYKIGQKFTIYFAVSRGTRHGTIEDIVSWRDIDTNKLCYTYVVNSEEYSNLQYMQPENYGNDVQIID